MDINVMYTSSSQYFGITMISIASLLEHNRKEDRLTIYFVNDGLTVENVNYLKEYVGHYSNADIRMVLCDDFLPRVFTLSLAGYRQSIFCKLYIDKTDVDRILFIDSDTVILDSLADLFAMEMGDNVLGGVQIMANSHYKKYFAEGRKDAYLNMGVGLFNLKAWRKLGISAKIDRLIASTQVEFIEENILCSVCQGHIMYLHPRYNLMSSILFFGPQRYRRVYRSVYTKHELQEAISTPAIIHYLNEIYVRPWYKGSDHPMKHCFNLYNAKLNDPVELQESPSKRRKSLLRTLSWLPAGLLGFLIRIKALVCCLTGGSVQEMNLKKQENVR